MGLQKIESYAIIDLSFSGTDFHGDVAQLGERTVRIRKVVGSIPIRSTKMCRQKRYTEETPHRSAVFLLF